MGYNYDFSTDFEASLGIMLSYFNCFGFLDDDDNLEEKYKLGNYLDIDGFYELSEYIRFSGLLKIHEVLRKLNKEQVFKEINMLPQFMFIMAEHDREQYPLLIIEK